MNKDDSAASKMPPFANHDVLSGRGRALEVHMHPGNCDFRDFIRQHAEEYARANRTEKGGKLVQYAEQMRAKNIRFLKQNKNGTWSELSEIETKQKIGHALRDARPDRKRSRSDFSQNHVLEVSSVKRQATVARHEEDHRGFSEEVDRSPKRTSPTVDEILLDIQRSKQRLSRSSSLESNPTGRPQFPSITAAQALATAAFPGTEALAMLSASSGPLGNIQGLRGLAEQATVSLTRGGDSRSAGQQAAVEAGTSLSPPGGGASMGRNTSSAMMRGLAVDVASQVVATPEGNREQAHGEQGPAGLDPLMAEACWELMHDSSGSPEIGSPETRDT